MPESSSPSAAQPLAHLERRLLAITGASEATLGEQAEQLGDLEVELLGLLPKLAEDDPTFDGLRGHPTLADASAWRAHLAHHEVAEVEPAAQALVDALHHDEVEHWEARALEAKAADGASASFDALSDRTLLLREGIERGCKVEDLRATRDTLRADVEAAIQRGIIGPAEQEARAKEHLDRADVVLTSLDDLEPHVASQHLAMVDDELTWLADCLAGQPGRWSARLRRKARRLRDERVERTLQRRLEKRFGKKRVGRFERLVMALIFFVLVALCIELAFDLPTSWRLGLAIADTMACGVFLTEFFVKLSMVQGRGRWFMRHALIDLLPSIPFGLVVIGEAAHTIDPTRAGRALRLFRIFRVARYLRWLLPLIRLLRGFGFLARGLDRLVRRYGHLLNRNIVLYPNRAERQRAEARAHSLLRSARHLRSELNHAWEDLLTEATREQRPAIGQLRVAAIARAQALGHCRRRREEGPPSDVTQDIPADVFIDTLERITPEEIEAEMGQEFVDRVARVVRIFARPPIRWFPFIRRYVPRLVPGRAPAEVVADASHSAAREMRRHHDRWFWVADLHGTLTPSEFVDRVGTAMVKSSLRPAWRLMLFGGFFLLVQLLLGIAQNTFLQSLHDQLSRFVGTTLVVLGAVCLVILGLGWWLKRLAGEATFFFEQTARAQFLGLTETIKGRQIPRDVALLDARVLAAELPYVAGEAAALPLAARRTLLEQTVHAWLVAPQSRPSLGPLSESFERVVLLYRDNLDGALFGESDTRTTSQLLGNPSLQQLLGFSKRIDRKEEKSLRALDLEQARPSLRGPYLWFSYISKALAHASARLIVEYNRSAMPLDEVATLGDKERSAYEAWLADRSSLRKNAGAGDTLGYVTTTFSVLHFLDDDPQRDAEIEARFGVRVREKMEQDRRALFRQVFGTAPLHARVKDQRVLNLYRVYERWFSNGRAFFIPLRALWRGVLVVGRFFRWVVRAVAEIRRPQARLDVEAAEGADFHAALRKIQRMRGPVAWTCTWLRARFDPEYLAIELPDTPHAETGTYAEDLAFLGARAEHEARIARERDRAEWDMRRLARLWDDGLAHKLGAILGVPAFGVGDEHHRAAAMAYRADMRGVRVLLSCSEIVRETMLEAASEPLRPLRLLPAWRLHRRFKRWWHAHGEGDALDRKAAWRAVRADALGSRRALEVWDTLGSEQARLRGIERLADLLRHVGRISEQLVTLRAIHTLSLIDLRNYREHVYRVGEYAASGDAPGPVLGGLPDEATASQALGA